MGKKFEENIQSNW